MSFRELRNTKAKTLYRVSATSVSEQMLIGLKWIQSFTIDSYGVKADNVTNIIPCSISSDSDYNNYQPTPASGEEADRILQKIQERSSWIGSGSTENSEGDDTYEDSEGTDSEDSSEDYSGDEDLTDSYDEM